jgi:hypothetical protein
MLANLRPALRGAIAGLSAAAAVALWFLLIDMLRGTPLRTPSFLFAALTGGAGDTLDVAGVALYTVLHFAVFAAIGAAAGALADRSGTPPHLIFGFILGVLLFDLLFYAGLAATGVDVVRGLGWPEVLAGNVIGGVVLVGGLHLLGVGPRVSWLDPLRRHETTRRGLIAGALGAAAVAAWFLIIDGMDGRPFFTPAALGSALFYGARGVEEVRVSATTVLGYTGLHMAAFLIAGLLAAALARAAERQPPVLLGAMLLFVSFEALFFGLLAIAAVWLLDAIHVWTIIVANIIAAGVVGAYLWHEHPALHAEVGRELEGAA